MTNCASLLAVIMITFPCYLMRPENWDLHGFERHCIAAKGSGGKVHGR